MIKESLGYGQDKKERILEGISENTGNTQEIITEGKMDDEPKSEVLNSKNLRKEDLFSPQNQEGDSKLSDFIETRDFSSSTSRSMTGPRDDVLILNSVYSQDKNTSPQKDQYTTYGVQLQNQRDSCKRYNLYLLGIIFFYSTRNPARGGHSNEHSCSKRLH